MKHQQQIANQRVVNMKSGIEKALENISVTQNAISKMDAERFEEHRESIVEDLEEVKDFLIWVANQ